MEDNLPFSVPPRKLKFTPKIPPRKTPKTPAPKPEEPEPHGEDLLDSRFFRLVKQADSRRSSISERKAASMEITFGKREDRTTALSFGIHEDENTVQDSDSLADHDDISSTSHDDHDDYVDPWDYNSDYPVTLPLRRPYAGNPEILNKEEFGKGSETLDEYDESRVNAAEELGLKDGNTDKRMFFIQMPAALPMKNKEKDGIEDKCRGLDDLPSGYMGKMKVYKSGAIKMKLGDAVFDVSPGSDCMFAQDVMAMNIKQKQCCVLGKPSKRAVVSPDVDNLLNTVIHLE